MFIGYDGRETGKRRAPQPSGSFRGRVSSSMFRARLLKVIRGESSGVFGSTLRMLLGWLEPAYRTIVFRRNRQFDRNPEKSVSVAAAVISVGNLTTGGTGKTPVVRWVVEQIAALDKRPAIVSRGYAARAGQPNDEWQELAICLPGISHVQNPDRVAAARSVIEQDAAEVVVVDDGFQHRRLRRNLDLVLIDATCPFGYDHLLPRGLLREPLSALARADAVVITRVDQVASEDVSLIRRRVGKWISPTQIAEIRFAASGLLDGRGGQRRLDELRGERIVGFCGIGNPAAFRQTLKDHGLDFVDFVEWPDHYRYEAADVSRLHAIARARDALALVCTVKDLVKIRDLPECGFPIAAIAVQPEWIAGESMVRELLRNAIAAFERKDTPNHQGGSERTGNPTPGLDGNR
jgi:tetraacyldisaccharide 4'-kinase